MIVGFGPQLHSVVELVFFLHSISYCICVFYVNCVLDLWYGYLCIYQQCFLHFSKIWSKDNVQICVMSLN